jgi:hypothetical protein
MRKRSSPIGVQFSRGISSDRRPSRTGHYLVEKLLRRHSIFVLEFSSNSPADLECPATPAQSPKVAVLPHPNAFRIVVFPAYRQTGICVLIIDYFAVRLPEHAQCFTCIVFLEL